MSIARVLTVGVVVGAGIGVVVHGGSERPWTPAAIVMDPAVAEGAKGLWVTVDANWVDEVVDRARSDSVESVRADVATLRAYRESEAKRELDRLHALGDSHLLAYSDESGDLPRIVDAEREAFGGLPELVEARAVSAPDGSREYRLAILDRTRFGPLWDIALEIRLLQSVLDEAP